MLDNLMSEYTDLMEKLQKNENELLKQGIQAINDNKVVMESILNKTADEYGYPTSQNLNEVITAINNGKITADIVNGEREDSVTAVIKAKCNEIVTAYNKGASGGGANGGSNNNSGGAGSNNANNSSANSSGSTKQQTQTTNGQTTLTPDAMDKIEGTNEKLIKLRNALNSMKGAGFEKYWTKKNGKPKSYINQRIAAEPNYDKIVNGKHLYPQILTEAGLKLLAKKLGVKYPASSGAKTANLNNYVKEAGFRTGGIAKLVKANGEDGLMMARNGEGFVSPENVQDIRDLMNITPNLTELVSNLTKIPDFKRVIPETTKNVSIDNITFDLPNVKNVSDFTDTIKKPEQQRAFAVAIGDAIAGKKLNINRY